MSENEEEEEAWTFRTLNHDISLAPSNPVPAKRKEELMVRLLLTIVILLTLTGCPPKQENDSTTAQQLAQRTAELEQARDSKSFWQTTASILVGLIILALVIGIVLGSKAKSDADRR